MMKTLNDYLTMNYQMEIPWMTTEKYLETLYSDPFTKIIY